MCAIVPPEGRIPNLRANYSGDAVRFLSLPPLTTVSSIEPSAGSTGIRDVFAAREQT